MDMDTYIKGIVEMHPREDDPREARIVGIIRDAMLQEEWVKDAHAKANALQIQGHREILASLGDAAKVRSIAQRVLKEFSSLFKAEIVEGKEFLATLPKDKPAFLFTNHFGTYKTFPIRAKADLGVEVPQFDYFYPFFGYFGALYPAAAAAGRDLSYASFQYPGPLDDSHRQAGFVHVPPRFVQNRTEYLDKQVRTLMAEHPQTLLVNFPEGKTTGKYSEGGPYSLEPFKTGGYVIAAEHGIPIVPVAQFFDPHRGFRLKIFEPYVLPEGDKASYEARAHQDQVAIQDWLDRQKS